MGRKHKHPEHENLERWLVSYADFITLLFATFVVLYALGQLDLAKLKTLRHSLQQAFNPTAANPAAGITGKTDGVMDGPPEASILNNSGNSVLDKIAPSPQDTTAPKDPTFEQIQQSVQAMNQAIKESTGGAAGIEGAQVSVTERGVVISISSTLFFDSGSATLKPMAQKALDKLVKSLKDSGRMINIEGHSDNTPIATAQFPSNWELSAARASSVVRYFVGKYQFSQSHIAAIGYADSRPKATNSTPLGRQKNRRVEIVLLSQAAGELSNNNTPLKAEITSAVTSPPSVHETIKTIRVSLETRREDPSKKPTRVELPPLPSLEDKTLSDTKAHTVSSSRHEASSKTHQKNTQPKTIRISMEARDLKKH